MLVEDEYVMENDIKMVGLDTLVCIFVYLSKLNLQYFPPCSCLFFIV